MRFVSVCFRRHTGERPTTLPLQGPIFTLQTIRHKDQRDAGRDDATIDQEIHVIDIVRHQGTIAV